MVKEKRLKSFVLMLIDIFLINIAYILSFYIRLGYDVPEIYTEVYKKNIVIIIGIYIISLALFKMYRSIWKIAGIDEVIYGLLACIIAGVVNFVYMETLDLRVPRIVTMLSCLFIIVLVNGIRLSFRFLRRLIIQADTLFKKGKEKVLIVGAGACGQIIIDEIRNNKDSKYSIVGLIDDNPNKKGTYLKGYKVLGNRNSILEIVKKKKIDDIFIAIPSLKGEEKKELVTICKEAVNNVKIVPGIYEMVDEEINFNKMRNVDLKDLLGRDEVKLDKTTISQYLKDKVVLVTGGGGSIGSELCRQIAKFQPKKLIILDVYENSAYDLQNELLRTMPSLNQEVVIASVRDRKRIEQIFNDYKPQVIFHAAAHKHVPLMEGSPSEAIKNNALGTLNVVECSDKYGAERFVLISTDKAVNPTNVMGATKRLCEMIVQAINKQSKTEFVAVRFGNVLGSNGSVIPLFKKQIEEGGPVTLTDRNITRYFMLIPEAAQLVLQASTFAKGGEIFVLDMGSPVKIYDLAENLIKLSGYEPNKDIEIITVGLRPGEKLYEELLMDEEGLKETTHEKIFIGRPGEFELDQIKEDLKKLLLVIDTGKKEDIKKELKRVVPTYKEPFEVNKEVAATK